MVKKVQINLSNKRFYALIIIGVTLIVIGVITLLNIGVYSPRITGDAIFDGYTEEIPNPGHGGDTVLVDVGGSEMTLQDAIDGGNIGGGVGTETDPTVNTYVKNKGNCAAITGGAGLCDGVDNVGSAGTLSCTTRSYASWSPKNGNTLCSENSEICVSLRFWWEGETSNGYASEDCEYASGRIKARCCKIA